MSPPPRPGALPALLAVAVAAAAATRAAAAAAVSSCTAESSGRCGEAPRPAGGATALPTDWSLLQKTSLLSSAGQLLLPDDSALVLTGASRAFGVVREDSSSGSRGSISHRIEEEADVELTKEQLQVMCYLRAVMNRTYLLDPPLPADSHCAVVSSSGAMKQHSHGAEIDSHKVVMRFNAAPTEGYEKYVGSRTTLRFGWATPKDTPGEQVAITPGDSKAADLRIKSAVRSLYPTQLGFHAQTDNLTTGFYGMATALSNCATVDAYEMAPSDSAKHAHYNYFNPATEKGALVNSWHGLFQAEHDLWSRLAINSVTERKRTGKTTYKGFNQLECPKELPHVASLEPGARASLLALLGPPSGPAAAAAAAGAASGRM